MTDDPLPDFAVHQMLAPKHRQPHVFEAEVMIPPEKSDSGYEHKERACKNCGAVRVTRARQCAVGPRVARLAARGRCTAR